MPLFGSSSGNNAPYNDPNYPNTMPGNTTTNGYNAGGNPGMGNQAPNNDSNYPNTTPGNTTANGYNAGGRTTNPNPGTGMTGNQGFQNQGYNNTLGGNDASYQNTGAVGVPPTGVLNSRGQHRSGGGHAMVGKIEQVVGTIVGSSSLKAKGLQKEQEAGALKLQEQDLQEARRLEQEAYARRQRAVAFGAHPDNRHLGGVAADAGGSSDPGSRLNQY